MSNKSKKKNKLIYFIIPLVFISVLVVFFLLTLFTENYKYKQKFTIKCDTGFMAKSAFLDVYEVKSGDTLLSIAKNEIGDINRADELIKLNRDQHSLSMSNGFLEIGYKLYLPPNGVFTSSGKLIGYKGEIATIIKNEWAIKSGPGGGAQYFYLNENTVFKGNQNDFKEGDCVKIIGDDEGRKALVIEHQ